jgi:hypothetical protein
VVKRTRLQRWLQHHWVGPIPTLGFLIGGFEFMGKLFVGRPIDTEAIPFAVALILWRPLERAQGRRNGRRGQDEGDV